MKTLYYSGMAEAVADSEISKFVDNIFSSSEEIFKTSTALVIDEIRARIKEETISPDDIAIFLDDEDGYETRFVIDKDGRSWDWQPSLNVHQDILMRLL